MRYYLILANLLLIPFLAKAETKTEEKRIQFYGFIRNAFYADSYRGIDVVQDQFYILPAYAGEDAAGEDINQAFQANYSAIASRLGAKINGPELLGAKSSAVLEFDFAGITSMYPSLFRIRHAYVKFDWQKSALWAGQNWHPFWCDAVTPRLGGLNGGAPFQPFARAPQIRYDYTFDDNFTLLGAVAYENQFPSKGFYPVADDIDKTMPIRFSGIPEVIVMAKYHKQNFEIGIGGDFKSILPINLTSPDGGVTNYKTNIKNNSYGIMAYGMYKNDKLYALIRGTYGQNMTHLTMPGGYGVKSVDPTTGAYEYTNYNNYAAFANITYGKKWVAGLMLGYGGNLGTSEKLYDMGAGKAKITGMFIGANSVMHNMYRVAPSVTLNLNKFSICAEYERTSAEYGTDDKAIGGVMDLNNGLFDKTVWTNNNRFLLMMMYHF